LAILLLVTTSQIRTLIRRAAVVPAAALLPLIVAGPAGAEVPEGWSDPDPVSFLPLFVVIGVIPITLGLLLALCVYGPALARGENVTPGADTPDEWFGGPRNRELAAPVGDAEAPAITGGGSGRW